MPPGLPFPLSYSGVYLSLSLLVTVTLTGTSSFDPSGYVTLVTAFPTLPFVAVDGLLTTVTVPGPLPFTLAMTSASSIT